MSSHGFTQMMLYYLQCMHEMPCILTGRGDRVDFTEFEAFMAWKPTGMGYVEDVMTGFFKFYTDESDHAFKWGDEVVSIRCTERLKKGAQNFKDSLKFKPEQKNLETGLVIENPKDQWIHIEDPIDLSNMHFRFYDSTSH